MVKSARRSCRELELSAHNRLLFQLWAPAVPFQLLWASAHRESDRRGMKGKRAAGGDVMQDSAAPAPASSVTESVGAATAQAVPSTEVPPYLPAPVKPAVRAQTLAGRPSQEHSDEQAITSPSLEKADF